MSLVEVDGIIYDEQLLTRARGFERLDSVGRESFVNHMHIDGKDREEIADRIIQKWADEMRARWPDRSFRIYRHTTPDELTIRFHVARSGVPNWCEEGVEVFAVGPAGNKMSPGS